ncbi:MAG: cytochrome C [Curvibacter sp. RIFCSPHIGHO2_12_FULL_63_18]|uniref:c-type cytochrome n=1 Tax=Rhodoferax sp. TaxID=50421 RepID=UPI0008D6B195|nr:cytochrome c [Rhodoferax sp.]OGO97530.1 MAG: cytochrome C [Curvibacter sp. GWA2_63_95]OGO98725.1 MAG: cytochrome C [Curvibacter sp. RIFCSPHIGHO2_12_FULL_63_18]HCX81386.1 cytochrome C [Rhodoferax sp.]
MKKLATLILASAAATLSVPAMAQFAKAEDAIKYRQNALFVMQQNFARVAAMAAGRAPLDTKVAAESAEVAAFVSKLPWAAFGEGMDKGAATKAKAEIWSDKAKFNDYAEKMQAEMNKLNAAAKTGNLDSIKAAVNATSGSCKTCHDAFRS